MSAATASVIRCGSSSVPAVAGATSSTDVELPKPAELLSDMGFLTPRDGFGAESGVDSFVDPAKIDEMKPYPGIDYLGMGYDIFHGNPEGDEKLTSEHLFSLT